MDSYVPEAIIIGMFLYLCTSEIAEAIKECYSMGVDVSEVGL